MTDQLRPLVLLAVTRALAWVALYLGLDPEVAHVLVPIAASWCTRVLTQSVTRCDRDPATSRRGQRRKPSR